jgi:thymidine kinase
LDNRKAIKLSSLKCIIIDEADIFFLDDRNYDAIQKIFNNEQIKKNRENI